MAKTIEWISTADKYTASQAFSAGLVNHVVKHEELLPFMNEISNKILKNAPTALKVAKRVVQYGMLNSFNDGCL